MQLQDVDDLIELRQLLQNEADEEAAAVPGAAGGPAPVVAEPQSGPAPALAAIQPQATAPLPPSDVTPSTAPANVTVVTTPKDLQRALLDGAVDVEIRAHLDMRSLSLAANPKIQGVETQINRKKLALLYSYNPLRSIRV